MALANFTNRSSNFTASADMFSKDSLPHAAILELDYAIKECLKRSGDQSVAFEELAADDVEPVSANSSGGSSFVAPRLAFVVGGLFFESLLIGLLSVVGIAGNFLSFLVLRLDHTSLTTSLILQALSLGDIVFLMNAFVYFSVRSLATFVGGGGAVHRFVLHALAHAHPFIYATGMAAQTAVNWLVVLVTVERCVVARRPLLAPVICTRRNALFASIAICVAAALYNVPRVFEWQVVQVYSCQRLAPILNDYQTYLEITNSETASSEFQLGMAMLSHYIRSRLGNMTDPDLWSPVGSELVDSKVYQFGYRVGAYVLLVSAGPVAVLVVLNLLLVLTLNVAEAKRNRAPAPPANSNNNALNTTSNPNEPLQKFTSNGTTNNPHFGHCPTDQTLAKPRCPDTIGDKNININNINITTTNNINNNENRVAQPESKHVSLFSSQTKYTKLIVVIVLTFMVCQTPAMALQVLKTLDMSLAEDPVVFFLIEISNSLVVLNCTLNFVIYCLYGKQFRRRSKRLLLRYLRRASRRCGWRGSRGGGNGHTPGARPGAPQVRLSTPRRPLFATGATPMTPTGRTLFTRTLTTPLRAVLTPRRAAAAAADAQVYPPCTAFECVVRPMPQAGGGFRAGLGPSYVGSPAHLEDRLRVEVCEFHLGQATRGVGATPGHTHVPNGHHGAGGNEPANQGSNTSESSNQNGHVPIKTRALINFAL